MHCPVRADPFEALGEGLDNSRPHFDTQRTVPLEIYVGGQDEVATRRQDTSNLVDFIGHIGDVLKHADTVDDVCHTVGQRYILIIPSKQTSHVPRPGLDTAGSPLDRLHGDRVRINASYVKAHTRHGKRQKRYSTAEINNMNGAVRRQGLP